MTIYKKTILLSLASSFLLITCGANQLEGRPIPDTSLMYPMDLGEKAKQDLTPQQQRELQINEDNVMNPFPG